MTVSRTIVIGGGLAGLLAARRHAAAGEQVLVLEATEDIGGAIAATMLGPVPINAGAEAYSCGSGAVDTLLTELGLAGSIVSPRTGLSSRLVSDAGGHVAPSGSLFGIPGRPLSREARAMLGWRGALRAALDRMLPAGYGLREKVTLGDYVRARMGRRVLERLVAPLVGGVHSADPDTVELSSVLPQLPAAVREHGSLQQAVRALRPRSGRSRSAGTAVHALAPTMAALPEALAAQLRDAGGEIRTGTTVTGLGRPAGGDPSGASGNPSGAGGDPSGIAGWTVTAGGEDLAADHLVLACPPDAARALLEPVDPELASLLPSAEATPVRLVALLLDDVRLDAFPTGTGALVAPGSQRVRAKALTHASAKWEHVHTAARDLTDAAHPHVVRLSYGRPGESLPEDDAHGPSGAEGTIIDRALADASVILGVELDRSHLRAARVITWDQTMRRPGPGHGEALAAITTALAERPDLELVGSWRSGTGIDAIVRADQSAAAQPAHSHAATAHAAASPLAAPQLSTDPTTTVPTPAH